MKEGFTFNKVSLMFLRKVIFKNFWWWGENRKEPKFKIKDWVFSVPPANFCPPINSLRYESSTTIPILTNEMGA